MTKTNVASIKLRDQENFETARNYDELTVQTSCFVFQWFEKEQTLLIPIDTVEYITTTREDVTK